MVFWQLVRQLAIPKEGIDSYSKEGARYIFRRKMFGIPKDFALTKRRYVATFTNGLVSVASAHQNKNALAPKFMAFVKN